MSAGDGGEGGESLSCTDEGDDEGDEEGGGEEGVVLVAILEEERED